MTWNGMRAELLRQLWSGLMVDGQAARVSLRPWWDHADPASMLAAYAEACHLEQAGLVRVVDHETVAPTAAGARAAEADALVEAGAVAQAWRRRRLVLDWVAAASDLAGVSCAALVGVTSLPEPDLRAALDYWLLDGSLTSRPGPVVRLTARGRTHVAELAAEPCGAGG